MGTDYATTNTELTKKITPTKARPPIPIMTNQQNTKNDQSRDIITANCLDELLAELDNLANDPLRLSLETNNLIETFTPRTYAKIIGETVVAEPFNHE